MKVLDKGSIELLGPHGLERWLLNVSKNIHKFSANIVTSYALFITIGIILLIGISYFINDISTTVLLLLIIGFNYIIDKEKEQTKKWSLLNVLINIVLFFFIIINLLIII